MPLYFVVREPKHKYRSAFHVAGVFVELPTRSAALRYGHESLALAVDRPHEWKKIKAYDTAPGTVVLL